MGNLLIRLRRTLIHIAGRSISSMMEFQFSDFSTQKLSPQSGRNLSFADISRQMKDFASSVSSVPPW
jgi:hypothetical protein